MLVWGFCAKGERLTPEAIIKKSQCSWNHYTPLLFIPLQDTPAGHIRYKLDHEVYPYSASIFEVEEQTGHVVTRVNLNEKPNLKFSVRIYILTSMDLCLFRLWYSSIVGVMKCTDKGKSTVLQKHSVLHHLILYINNNNSHLMKLI